MRVALLSFYDFNEVRGGTELFANYFLSAFRDAEFITYSASKKFAFGPNLTRLNLEYARMAWAMDRQLKEMCRQKEIDVVFSNDISGLGLKLMTPEIPSSMIFHYTYHELAESTLIGKRGYLPSRHLMPILESFSAVGKTAVAVGPKVQKALSKYYGINSRLIENGIPLDIFKPLDKMESRERLGITWRGPLGIFVGRAENAKGFDIVQTIAKRRSDIKILCVTPSKVRNNDLIVVGSVKNTAMPLYYGAADFLIFPSRYESLSYTSMEALACDLPVVASKTGVFEDLNEQDVGVLANSFEWEEFSRGIDKVMSLDIHPRDVAVRRFSIERFRADYVALAKEMAKSQN